MTNPRNTDLPPELRAMNAAMDAVFGAVDGSDGVVERGPVRSTKAVRDIELSFVYPPIPDRNFDWQATRKGWEPGELVGQGRTPIVALADLLEREMEDES
jgi:hypothetical protein